MALFRIDLDRLGQLGEGVVEFRIADNERCPAWCAETRRWATIVTAFFSVDSAERKLAAANINDAEVGKRVKVVRIFGQDFLILFFGRPIFALLETLFRRPRNILQIIRHVRFGSR